MDIQEAIEYPHRQLMHARHKAAYFQRNEMILVNLPKK